ncbi:hypothetical protein J7F03_20585 [Streptomyces sp. ISL-43]|uniref:hypothetical protein n=1 Tax=Streptomyces sp. ISL-43 TaxID=2819183 RepID=UPI001BEC76E1|nr:hypothetical protein [Streptomyces sp. ISL-43]MBT2449441.1 hypothetical protein [Streptomyces sp. ISL-43]
MSARTALREALLLIHRPEDADRLIADYDAETAKARTAPGLDERALRLANHITNTGGEWTTGKAHRWVTEAISPKPPIHFTRHSLQALAAYGYLTERREPGRVSYTPNYVKDGQ